MTDQVNPFVSVCMITYNHESFISQAIEGVLTQECNFHFELVIGEDCSPDSTRVICEQFTEQHPGIIRLLASDRNLGMMPNFIRTLNDCTGKYIAFCEGDDYWTDPHKLQKQVDFLEANPTYGLIHTDYYKLHQKIGRYERNSVLKVRDVHNKSDYDELLTANGIQTLTVCLRRDILIQYFKDIKPEEQPWLLGDYPIWLYYALHSQIHYIPEKMATYRVLPESATFSRNREKEYQFVKSVYDVRFFFMDKYGCNEETRRNVNRSFVEGSAQSEINIGFDKRDASFIEKALETKRENRIFITLLDKIKLYSTQTLALWYLARLLLSIKRKSESRSTKFIKSKQIKINLSPKDTYTCLQ